MFEAVGLVEIENGEDLLWIVGKKGLDVQGGCLGVFEDGFSVGRPACRRRPSSKAATMAAAFALPKPSSFSSRRSWTERFGKGVKVIAVFLEDLAGEVHGAHAAG